MSAQPAKKQSFDVIRPGTGEYRALNHRMAAPRPVREYSFVVDKPGQIVVREYGSGQIAPDLTPPEGLRAILRDGTTVVITRHRVN